MNLLEQRQGRAVLFTALYLSEGAPLGFIWWVLPAWLRMRGLPLAQITSLPALLVLPWTFNFLWAPLVDALAIRTAEAHERGSLNGYMQAGMLLGRSLFGGGALLVAGSGSVVELRAGFDFDAQRLCFFA